MSEIMDRLLANEVFINAIVAIIASALLALFTWLGAQVRRLVKDKDKADAITGAAQEAVWEVWEEFVKGWKEVSADGKLTKEERAQALATAQAKLISKARAEGVDIARELGQAGIRRLIETTIQGFKSGSSTIKVKK